MKTAPVIFLMLSFAAIPAAAQTPDSDRILKAIQSLSDKVDHLQAVVLGDLVDDGGFAHGRAAGNERHQLGTDALSDGGLGLVDGHHEGHSSFL